MIREMEIEIQELRDSVTQINNKVKLLETKLRETNENKETAEEALGNSRKENEGKERQIKKLKSDIILYKEKYEHA